VIAHTLSDLEITRAAHLWIQQHGDDATAKARQKVDEIRRKGDVEGADELRKPQSRGHLMRFSTVAVNMIYSPGAVHKGSAQEGDYEDRRHNGRLLP
jgi:hypothetical protein